MTRRSRYGLLRAALQAAMLLSAAQAHAADKLILAFGDSLIAGPGLQANENFSAQLEAALRRNGQSVHVQNGGVSGDTSAAGRGRLAWVLAGLKTRPALVIVELGANDMLRGINPVQTRANLSALITDLKQRKLPMLLAGMRAAPNMGPDYQKQFDQIYPALAHTYHVPFYRFFLEGVTGNRALLNADQLHPNAKGVAVIVRQLKPQIIKLLRN